MIIGGMVMLFFIIVYASIRSGVPHIVRVGGCILTWMFFGFTYHILKDSFASAPLLVMIPIVFFITCCYVSYVAIINYKNL